MFRRGNGPEIDMGCGPDDLDVGQEIIIPGLEVQGGQLVVPSVAESIPDEFEEFRPKHRPGVDQATEGTFYAARLFLMRGAELGYHCHVYEIRRKTDTGLMLTVVGDRTQDVFAERHRSGSVKKPMDLGKVGSEEKLWIAEQAVSQIGGFPQENRRRPSKHAELIHSVSGARV